uniref:response regulator n=1 Tax=Algoriphagus sp. TaxID=1872435 RepID=UPI0025FEAD33
MHILLVEDDLTYSRIVKTFLEKNGYAIQTCIKVKDAQQMMATNNFDLIIADFRLPDGTGMELLQWTKSKYPHTQVILITHYSDIRIAIKAMKLGAFEYITKPINPDELLATVKESLSTTNPVVQKFPSTPQKPAVPKIAKGSYVIGSS